MLFVWIGGVAINPPWENNNPRPPGQKRRRSVRLLVEVTQDLVEGARAVVDVTTPSPASPSPPTNQSQSSRVRAAEWSTSCSARGANRCVGSSFELRG